MNDFGLDLAVIGHGRTAALVDPSSRIVWWCYPRFDGDPILSRLVAGSEAKGFSDVLLEGMVDFSSDYVRNTAIFSTVLTNDKGAPIRITDFVPRFREYDCIFRHPRGSSSPFVSSRYEWLRSTIHAPPALRISAHRLSAVSNVSVPTRIW
jgi:Domain of unknown function (DUF5911)